MSITSKNEEIIANQLAWMSISGWWTTSCLPRASNLADRRLQSKSLRTSRLSFLLFPNKTPITFKLLVRLLKQETLFHFYRSWRFKIHRLFNCFRWFDWFRFLNFRLFGTRFSKMTICFCRTYYRAIRRVISSSFLSFSSIRRFLSWNMKVQSTFK